MSKLIDKISYADFSVIKYDYFVQNPSSSELVKT